MPLLKCIYCSRRLHSCCPTETQNNNQGLKQRVLLPGQSPMQLNYCGILEKNKLVPLFLPQKKRSETIDNIMLTDDPNTLNLQNDEI